MKHASHTIKIMVLAVALGCAFAGNAAFADLPAPAAHPAIWCPALPQNVPLGIARNKLYKHIAMHDRGLNSEQQDVRTRIDFSILEGKVDTLQLLLAYYQKSPANLKKIMSAVASDLHGTGVRVEYRVDRRWNQSPKEPNKIMVGYLKVSNEHGRNWIKVSTEPGYGVSASDRSGIPADGGPQKFYDLAAQRVLRQIGESAVHNLQPRH